MAQDGGRGWFRKRTKAVPEPEPTTLEARTPAPAPQPELRPSESSVESDPLDELFGEAQWSPEARQARDPASASADAEHAARVGNEISEQHVEAPRQTPVAESGDRSWPHLASESISSANPDHDAAQPRDDWSIEGERAPEGTRLAEAARPSEIDQPVQVDQTVPTDQAVHTLGHEVTETHLHTGPEGQSAPSEVARPELTWVIPESTAPQRPASAHEDSPVEILPAPNALPAPKPPPLPQREGQGLDGSGDIAGTAHESRFDWDAATAAALSGDPLDSRDTMAPSPSRGDPDKLLEDIIREIVGDAAAETVSSLQQPRIQFESAPPGEPVPPTRAVEPAEHFDRGVQPVSPDDSDATGPGTGENGVSGNEVASATAIPAADVASSVSTPPIGDAAQPQQASTTSVEPSPSAAPEVARRFDTARLVPDVSRETHQLNGGTPLADQIADETRRRLALEQAVLPLPPETRIFTISNQKGGVGKTTSAVNLAAALARAGAKVLVVDLDPQGNASTALGVDHRSDQQSVYEVLVADLPLSEVVRPSTEHERLDCVPATIHLAGAEIELVSLVAREQRLRRALDAHLAEMAEPYDYVFIDCPPSLGLLTINAFVAAREVLIPIQCEYYALEGLSQLLSNIELIEKHLNPDLRLSTILLTMYDSRTNLAQQVAQEVRDHFPQQTLDTIIPRSVRVSEAPSYGQSVISYDFASTGSLSYREAAAEIAWRGASEPKESN
jgi:cellulose biosynthesis protein BcsQ